MSERPKQENWHCVSSLGLIRSQVDQRVICAMPHALNKRAIKMRKPCDRAEITPEMHLIAAAPDMLEALEDIILQGGFRDFSHISQVATLIAKAAGKEEA